MIHCYDGPLKGMMVGAGGGAGYVHVAYMITSEPHIVRTAEYFIWPEARVALYVGELA